MAIPMSSAVNPMAANYQPMIPMSSATNPRAAIYKPPAQPRPATTTTTQRTPAVQTSTQPMMSSQATQAVSAPSYQMPSFDQESLNREIENAYQSGMGYLAGVEAQLQPQYQSALQEAEAAFKTQQEMLGGQRQQAQTQLQEQATKGQQAYETALSQARQMYEQLQRGYQQRFGGASSAGQAASEIANVERLRQQGQSYRSLQDINRQVQAGLQSVEQQYNQNLLQLQQNKVAAQNEARRNFEDKLNQINAQRAQLGVNKASQRLQALQDLRTQLLSIEQANRQYQMALDLQKQQNQLTLANSVKGISSITQPTSTLTDNLIKNYISTQPALPVVSQPAQASAQSMTGQANLGRADEFYRNLSLPVVTGSSAQLRRA